MTFCKAEDWTCWELSALQCSWNRSTLRGKDLRSYSQKQTLALFWLCLSNTVRGGGSISVKRDLTGIHQHKSLYPLCFHWTWPNVYATLLLFLYHQAKTFLRERSCITRSLPRGSKVKVWIFLAGLWKKQKRNTPWSPRGTLSSGEWVTLSSFVRILPTNASQFVLWREPSAFHGKKGWLLAGLVPDFGSVRNRTGHSVPRILQWPGVCSKLRQWELAGRKMDIDILIFQQAYFTNYSN